MRCNCKEHIADLKAEHMRLVVALTDQIEYLRAQLAPTPPSPGRASPTVWPEDDLLAGTLSEEEEQIKALQHFGHIDPTEADEAIQTLAAHGVHVK